MDTAVVNLIANMGFLSVMEAEKSIQANAGAEVNLLKVEGSRWILHRMRLFYSISLFGKSWLGSKSGETESSEIRLRVFLPFPAAAIQVAVFLVFIKMLMLDVLT